MNQKGYVKINHKGITYNYKKIFSKEEKNEEYILQDNMRCPSNVTLYFVRICICVNKIF